MISWKGTLKGNAESIKLYIVFKDIATLKIKKAPEGEVWVDDNATVVK
jgi:hypothetical protein